MAYYIGLNYGLIRHPLIHAEGRSATVSYGVETSGGDLSQAQLNALDNEFRNNWLAQLDTQVTVGPAEGYVGGTGGVPGALLVSSVNPQAGASNQLRPPGSVALIVRKYGDGIGRRNRGRCFFPWVLSESSVGETGIVAPANLTVYQTLVEAWLADIEAVSGIDRMVILHETSTPGASTPSVVTGLAVAPTCGHQRRRDAS